MAKQQPRSRMRRRKRRQRRIFSIFMLIGLLSFVVLGGAIGYFAWKLTDVAADTQETLERGEKSELREVAVDPKEDNISVLFLGVDNRDGELDGLSDAMLLATFNKQEHSVKITSIPRDSLVTIPGRGEDKITHAHAYGGTDLAVRTVEELFDIPVDYFVKLNFEAFIEIINALDGIEVDVPFTFTEQDSEGNKGAITINEGTQVLNGEEALAYVRMRKKDPRGDLGRGERQQQVIEALIRKSASLSSIRNYDEVLNSIEEHMSMNLTFGNLLSLHGYASSLESIERLQLQGENTYINNVYYYTLQQESKDSISNALRAHLEVGENDTRQPGTSTATQDSQALNETEYE
ncbi:LCP family protein [Alteribacillus iranensis]|uniref:Cell envelope-related function transcriptional attenuator common domain-containing protein n=1 Tax=Alteribacillus iranensis TaxID=930128 RepID=A0A1I2EJ63_9BACI|nr:LCP family protein [Alteribacillus iranensis]SFE92451.1 cell envelope-related function transcriptional attenuator common domain-containing protein [Alteribacillus iranensis]